MGSVLGELETPCVIVDLDVAERNIEAMAGNVQDRGLQHRPHIKTHKSIFFAELQRKWGASGFTCAKLSEAEVLAQAGFTDILIAFPLVGQKKLDRLYQLAQKVNVTVVADSEAVAEGLSTVGERLGRKLPLLIEIDSGLHRCGRRPGIDTVQFAQRIQHFLGIDIVGIMSYAGQIYDDNGAEAIRQTAHQERQTLVQTADLLRSEGFTVRIVSGGSSISAKFLDELNGLTEIRSGNYVFHDLAQLATGLVTVDDCALRVLVTVVSVPEAGRAIIDAGTKTLTSDTAHFATGYGFIIEHPEMQIYRLNEEHGYIRFDPQVPIQVGDRLTIIPNHACVLPNLCDELVGVRGQEVVHKISVSCRGKNY